MKEKEVVEVKCTNSWALYLTLCHIANPLELCDQPLILDMIFIGTLQLHVGVDVSFFLNCPI